MAQRVVVIGSGFGGLATAIRRAAAGDSVTVLEARDAPGGRAYTYRQDGFTFDGGPTVITAPWLITELFELAGKDPSDYVDIRPISPFYRIFFPDGDHFDYSADTQAMVDQIREMSDDAGDAGGYLEFLTQSKRIFAKGFTELADQPFLKLTDMLKIAPDLVRLKSHKTVYDYVSGFVTDDRLRQVLSFHPLLVGGNPFQTTSIYVLIHYLEREWGVHFAMGGTAAVVDAMVRLLGELGGELRCSAPVAEITTANGRATGVRLADGEEIAADVVVSNADAANTYRTLLPSVRRRRMTDRRFRRTKFSMSLVVIYFGTDRRYGRSRVSDDGVPGTGDKARSTGFGAGRDGDGMAWRDGAPELAHHNIILGPRYRELLDDIFVDKRLAEDFSLYLHMPTITDPSLAPEGCEAFYVLSPVPHLGGATDWAAAAKPYRDRIMGFLEKRYLPNLSRHIVTERMIDPRHFEGELGSYLGSAFSVQPTLTQSAWFRPHNRSEELPNLYLVGAGTHPGAGLPGVLSSAKIADRLIAEGEATAPSRRTVSSPA